MSDTTSAPSLNDERLAILAVNPTEANNALGKEVRAMARELQSRRADPIRAELLEALKYAAMALEEAAGAICAWDEHHPADAASANIAYRKICVAITRAEME